MASSSMNNICYRCRLRSTNPKEYCTRCLAFYDQEIKDHWLHIISSTANALQSLKHEQKTTESSHSKTQAMLTHRKRALEAKKLTGGDEYRKLLIELSERDEIYKDIKEELDGRRRDAEKALEKDRGRFRDELLRFGEETGRVLDKKAVAAMVDSAWF